MLVSVIFVAFMYQFDESQSPRCTDEKIAKYRNKWFLENVTHVIHHKVFDQTA
jgi:hypothetical protein